MKCDILKQKNAIKCNKSISFENNGVQNQQSKNFIQIVEDAALAVENGKKHSHQWRIKNCYLEKFKEKVCSNIDYLEKAFSFDEIHCIVKKSKAYGIGELAIYDTAVRIGNFKKMYPDKIYLHCGTKKGAEKLLGRKIKKKYITKEELKGKLPPKILELSCDDIETYLCVNKKNF